MTTQTEVQPLSIPDAQPVYPTSDDLIGMFRKYRITPRRNFLFGPFSEGRPTEACAIGVMIFDRFGAESQERLHTTAVLARLLGDAEGFWTEGVIRGFDRSRGDLRGWVENWDFMIGYETGQAVARWAFGERA